MKVEMFFNLVKQRDLSRVLEIIWKQMKDFFYFKLRDLKFAHETLKKL